MEYLGKYKICYEICDFVLELMDIEVKRHIINFPDKMTLGINITFEGISQLGENMFGITLLFSLIGSEQKSLENPHFEIRLKYIMEITININRNLDIKNEEDDGLLKNYVWFLAYPEIRETVNYLANRIGLSNLGIPFKTVGKADKIKD